jgi:hypothetical protein
VGQRRHPGLDAEERERQHEVAAHPADREAQVGPAHVQFGGGQQTERLLAVDEHEVLAAVHGHRGEALVGARRQRAAQPARAEHGHARGPPQLGQRRGVGGGQHRPRPHAGQRQDRRRRGPAAGQDDVRARGVRRVVGRHDAGVQRVDHRGRHAARRVLARAEHERHVARLPGARLQRRRSVAQQRPERPGHGGLDAGGLRPAPPATAQRRHRASPPRRAG